MRSKLSPSSMLQTQLIDKKRYRKSLDIIDINRFNPPIDSGNHSISSILIDLIHRLISIDIGNRQKSKSEKIIYQLLSINKIDNNRQESIKNRYRFLSENHRQSSKSQLFFFIDFHRLISEIDINHRLLSIRLACCPPHSGTEGQIVQVPNYPSQKLDDQIIRFSRISQLEYSKDTRVHFSSEVELSQLSREMIGPMLVSFPPEIW